MIYAAGAHVVQVRFAGQVFRESAKAGNKELARRAEHKSAV